MKMNGDELHEALMGLWSRPAIVPRMKGSFRKLQIGSGFACTISSALETDLRSRNMIVALNGKLFAARDKSDLLVKEAQTTWQRVEANASAKMLRFDVEGAR